MSNIQHKEHTNKINPFNNNMSFKFKKPLTKAVNTLSAIFHNFKKNSSKELSDFKIEKQSKSADVAESNITKEAINIEIEKLDAMLLNPNCEHSNLLEQAYLILMLLYRRNENLERKFADDKEPQLFKLVSELKGSHNSWSFLAVTAGAGLLQIGGGLAGIGSFVPGSTLGTSLANRSNLLSFLSSPAANKSVRDMGKLVSDVGQGSNGFSQIFSNKSTAKQELVRHILDEERRHRTELDKDCEKSRGEISSSQNSLKEISKAFFAAGEKAAG